MSDDPMSTRVADSIEADGSRCWSMAAAQEQGLAQSLGMANGGDT